MDGLFQVGFEDIQSAFGIDVDLYKAYVEGEILKNEDLVKLIQYRDSGVDWNVATPNGGAGTTLNACVLYSLIRHYLMSFVIETGVSGGFYTAFMLAALNMNNYHGILESIELSTDKKEIGKLVPKFKLNEGVDWNLTLGKSSLDYFEDMKFMRVCHNAELYCHDSLHTYSHMLKELNHFKQSVCSDFFIYIDDQDSEMFWKRCIQSRMFLKLGYSVKYISGNESRLQGHLGGFLHYKKIDK
jgi:hypothetical protein